MEAFPTFTINRRNYRDQRKLSAEARGIGQCKLQNKSRTIMEKMDNYVV